MATIYYTLSAKTNKDTRRNEVLVRFVHGRINQRAKSGVFVPADYWNAEQQTLTVPKLRVIGGEQRELIEELSAAKMRLADLRAAIMQSFIDAGAGVSAFAPDWLTSTIDRHNNPDKYTNAPKTVYFLDVFEQFINAAPMSDGRREQMRVVFRMWQRFELYRRTRYDVETITAETLTDFETFVHDEHEIILTRPELLELIPDGKTGTTKGGNPSKRKPARRGQNTINDKMNKLRVAFSWAVNQEITKNNPFKKYTFHESIYGTPYFITIDERNALYNFDFSTRPALSVQRDIFVFQCVIGCRVGDLYKMTRENVVNGAIEYIPHKTKEGRPVVVRVPLNAVALSILNRYTDGTNPAAPLFPFIAQQRYNDAIKEMFKIAGLTRPVTVINTLTREPEQRPLNEVASSHLARRAFIGNLYKQVKDPNLIGKLSGHVEGSRAFARYRDIDEDTCKDLVKMLE